MIIKNSKITLQQDEKGIVAIVVTMIIMIVLTLIVTGFAQLARREQRSTLSRQLASQAFYAAESGINDARRAINDTDTNINNNFNTNPNYLGQKDSCNPLPGSVNFLGRDSNVVSVDAGVKYSCLLINKKLKNSIVDLSTEVSDIQDLQSYSSALAPNTKRLEKLQISWKDTTQGVVDVNTDANLPASSAWGVKIGMIRLDIVPYDTLNASSLRDSLFTVFLRPSPTAGSGETIITYNPSVKGKLVEVKCFSEGYCKVDLEIPLAVAKNKNLVRMKSIYRSSTVALCANDCSGDTVFIGNQVEVDSTGKAGDILKRIKVRIPKKPDAGSTDIPEFVLDSSSGICKKIEVSPKTFTSGGCSY
ncbi:MAG: pilus assembly PilX N-terminal domain-containing protein [Candidatus Saccharibacteria bacterium]